MSDDALDQLFRDAHLKEGVEPLFSDTFWNEMESMLPEVPSRKRRPVFLWLTAASVLLLGTLIYWLIPNGVHPSDSKFKDLAKNPHIPEFRDKDSKDDRQHKHIDFKGQGFFTSDATVKVNSADQHYLNSKGKELHNRYNKGEIAIPFNPGPGELVIQEESDSSEGVITPIDEVVDLNSIAFERRGFNINPDDQKQINKSKEIKPVLTTAYLETGFTLGQSPYVNAAGSRDVVAGSILGGGIQVNAPKTYFQGGIQLRLEGFKGLSYVENNFTQNIVRHVDVKQLYSVEFPLSFGYQNYHHQLGISFIPGIQCFMFGKEQVIQNNMEVRNENITGPVAHSNSATLEVGLHYYYRFNSRWSAGLKCNMDVLRPFHTNYYLGSTTLYPINGQVLLRANIFK